LIRLKVDLSRLVIKYKCKKFVKIIIRLLKCILLQSPWNAEVVGWDLKERHPWLKIPAG